MYNVVFIICTKKRPYKLKKLINSINRIHQNSFNITIIIIENDIMPRSKFIINKINKKFKIHYLIERKIGIPYARNKGLNLLKKMNFDFFCFVDDDCEIDSKWLTNNKHFSIKSNADIIGGPQIPKSNYLISKLLDINHKHFKKVRWIATNNAFCKKKILKKNILFDPTLSRMGGSDQLFFMMLNKLNLKIMWNKNSIVYENIDEKRKSLKYFIQRNLRYSTSSFLIFKKCHNFVYSIFFNLLKIIIEILLIFKNLFLLITSFKRYFFKLLQNIIKIVGIILGVFSFRINNY